MNYEQEYKEALERAKTLYENANGMILKKWVERVFPELKESEDERIRRWLIHYFKEVCDNSEKEKKGVLAWLEKQGEQSDANKEYWRGYREGKQEILDKYAELEKQGEQKPNDKVETKYHEGDWVILTAGELSITLQIIKVDTNRKLYYFNDNIYLPIVDEECLRFWSIQDAKAGDVLEFGDHGRLVTGLLSFVNKTTGKVDVSCLLEGDKFKVGVFYNLDTVNPHPTTKEQRYLLFQKMKEAGYEWDAEKKELNKIEQSSAWSEENKSYLLDFTRWFEQKAKAYDINLPMRGFDRCAFCKEIIERLRICENLVWENIDETQRANAIIMLKEGARRVYAKDSIDKCVDWLKSLRPQTRWKPSDRELGAILAAIADEKQKGSDVAKELLKIYQQLKKLREE